MENKLVHWHQKWLRYRKLQRIALGLAVSLPLMALGYVYFNMHWAWSAILPVLAVAGILLSDRALKSPAGEFARFMDARYPQLEESTALVLNRQGSLNLLEELQRERVHTSLAALDEPEVIGQNLKRALLTLLVTVAVTLALIYLPKVLNRPLVQNTVQINGKVVKDIIPPSIRQVRLTVRPPAYTGLPARTQKQFSMQVEEGARVSWEVETDQKAKDLHFLINDKQKISLQPSGDSTEWRASTVFSSPGFYQVVIDGKRSDLYQIDVVRDHPAGISISSPKPYSQIGFGEEKRVLLKGYLHDDYGIRNSFIHATIASGKGEGVSFREQNLSLSGSGGKRMDFNKLIDLDALKMQPGDELYFYIQATDSKGHITKSDAYTVLVKDTTELMSMEGLISGVNLMPEYFRSQRQIIIDTEKLLKEQGSISKEEFQNRSNNLGIDQKLLRLRYGKFLGEEGETNVGIDEEHDPNHKDHTEEKKPDPADFNNAQKIIDEVSHKHDIAEDATFFDAATKSQLKATLTEMWKSELRLRTFKPREALPFEYKALQLLKDLQQQSRAYVAKTLYKAPPFLPEKRLSGDLSKIISPVFDKQAKERDTDTERLKQLASTLQNLEANAALSTASRTDISYLASVFSRQAQINPSAYLPAARAARNALSANKINATDLQALQQGLQRLLPAKPTSPQKRAEGPAGTLSDAYFKNLGRAGN